MKVTDSVRIAITDWERGELEASMLHACNAVDGTARKLRSDLGNKQRFILVLRENYPILGPMGLPGINLVTTRFPVTIRRPTTPDGKPDIADVLYGIHRCCHAHGDDMPDGFDLIQDAAGPNRLTHLEVRQGRIRFSDRIIFGLLAVAVLSPANKDHAVHQLSGYYLTYGNLPKLLINEWWGRANDFAEIVAQDPSPRVTLDFGDWIS
jgi:hypothetical protein